MVNENYYYITPTDIKNLNYCKRLIYFEKCLLISENLTNNYKVQKGKELHNKKEKENIRYLRKRIDVINKMNNVELYSNKYHFKGIVDEILFFNNGLCSPLDYKYAKYNNVIYDSIKTQMAMYALMIEETFNVKVKDAYIVYCLSNNFLYKLEITKKLINKVLKDIDEYYEIIKGYFPKKAKYSNRCTDCFYRNICIY